MKYPLFICTVLLILTACSRDKPVDTNAGAGSANEATHFVVALDGQLELKRQGWSKYVPAAFGTALRRGDLLRLDSGQATVVCSDLSVVGVQRGGGGVPCSGSRTELTYNGSKVNATRASTVDGIPALLSPRRTKLLTAHPTLHWQPVSGATSYTVSVSGPNVTWSTEVRGATEIPYPSSAPALTPGQTYKVAITAGKRSSDEEGVPDLGFSILSDQDAAAVRDAERKIRSLAVPDPAKQFLVGSLYASRGLNSEALDLIAPLAAKGTDGATARLAGDLLLGSGLPRQAEEQYLAALERARGLSDTEGQALAESKLATIYDLIGNREEAATHYGEALRLYTELGDSSAVKQIQERQKGGGSR